MKIKFTSEYLHWIEQKKELAPEEELLITQLETDPNFEKKIIKTRGIFNIPLDGFPESAIGKKNPKNPWGTYSKAITDMFIKKTFIIKKDKRFRNSKLPKGMNDYVLLHSYATKICCQYNLMNWWELPMMCFIVFNILPLSPSGVGITYFYDDRTMLNLLEYSGSMTIMISQRMSKKQLYDWINKEWKNGLEDEINKLPPSPYTRITQIKVYKRIAELKHQGMTAEEISNKLHEDKMGTYDYALIEPMYNRYKKYLSRR